MVEEKPYEEVRVEWNGERLIAIPKEKARLTGQTSQFFGL